MASAPRAPRDPDATAIEGFIEKFDQEHAALLRRCRVVLRKRFPTAHEIVYDNYNFLVFGFSTTGRASDTIVSLVGGSNGVGLAFPYCGARLSDPERLLRGSGSSNRFVRVSHASVLTSPSVARLIDEATALAKTPLPAGGRGPTAIKSVSATQRPRRKHGRADSTARAAR